MSESLVHERYNFNMTSFFWMKLALGQPARNTPQKSDLAADTKLTDGVECVSML